MKRRIFALAAVLCMLLTGCSSLLNRQYSTVTEHTSKYWESGSEDTLRAENYQDIVNDLMLLIGRHTEGASLRHYSEGDSAVVAGTLEQATTEVQQQTALGAYAVEYITSGSNSQHGYFEVAIHISYRRTADQVRNIVNATSVSAIPDLLSEAVRDGRESLTVRIGYWTPDSKAEVQKAIARVRDIWKLNAAKPWRVIYYPASGNVGIIEFSLKSSAQALTGSGDKNQTPGG